MVDRATAYPNSRSELLNIHVEQKDTSELWCVDIRVKKNRQIVKHRRKRFSDLEAAIEWRDKMRAELGLPEAER